MRAQDVCARGFAEAHPQDAARLIEQYAAPAAAAFIDGLTADAAAAVIERMNPVAAVGCLSLMEPERGSAVIAALSPRVAVALLRRLPHAEQDALVSALPDDSQDRVRRLLSYGENTVGSVTDPDVLALAHDLSLGEALRQLRRHHRAAHHHVYVVDRSQRLVGVMHIRDLVGARAKGTLAGIMQPADESLVATSRLASAAAHPAWRHLDTLPVIDDSGVLLGMLRYRQLRQLDTTTGPGGITDTLLSLGELYWIGLSTFLPGVSSTSEAHEPASQSGEGKHHDA